MPKEQAEYEVEAIIGKRRKKNSGSVQYRVLWNGFPKEQATWQPEEHLENVDYMIEQFNQKVQEKNSKTPIEANKPQVNHKQKIIQEGEKIVQEINKKEQILNKNITPAKKLTNMVIQSDDDNNDNKIQQQVYSQNSSRQVSPKPKTPPIRSTPMTGVIKKTDPPKAQKRTPVPLPIQQKKTPAANVFSKSNVQKKPIQQTLQSHLKGSTPINKETNNYKSNLKAEEDKTTIADEKMRNAQFSDDDYDEPNFQVTGMYIAESGKYAFTVVDKKINQRITLRRRDVLKRDPKALIKYYEKLVSIV